MLTKLPDIPLFNNNFPYYPIDKEYRNKELKRFITNDKWNELFSIEPNTGSYEFKSGYTLGNSYLWSFFNYAWSSIKCNDKLTPLDIYYNKDLLLDCLSRNFDDESIKTILPSKLRELLKTDIRVQTVNNFRPISAQVIYDCFLEDFDSVVYDPCHGFGGRMLGAIKSEKVAKYIGTDPASQTSNTLKDVYAHIKDQDSLLNTEIELFNEPAENFKLKPNSIDLVLTSPPYFNTEKYSAEKTQSYIKYNTKELWLNDFLKPMLYNCFECLKPDGKLLLNIANVETFKDLELQALNIALSLGFKLKCIHKYVLALRSPINRQTKFEPIFELIKE